MRLELIVKLTLRFHALPHRKHSPKKKMTTPYPTIKNSRLLITNNFRKTHQQIIKIISVEWVACIAGSGRGGAIRYFSARVKDVAAARDRSSYCQKIQRHIEAQFLWVA